jgi:WD40 repeat protein
VRILQGHTDAVRCLSYSPDGRYLASGGEDGTVRLWGLAAGGIEAGLLEHADSVEALSFAPDGATLVTGTAGGEVIAWDVAQRQCRSSAPTREEAAIRFVVHSPDGAVVAIACWGRTLSVYDARILKGLWITPATSLYTALAFAPNQRVMSAATEDGLLTRFSLSPQRPGITLDKGIPVYALAHSPDGRLLAAGRANGEIALWEAQRGRLEATLSGHTWTIYSLAFTPDGRTLVSGGADGTVRLWDVAARRERRCFRWHTRWVTCLAVAPDGMTAAAGSADHTIVMWDLDED